jgi:hypothetical protein
VLAPTEELRGLALGVVPDLHAVLAALRQEEVRG